MATKFDESVDPGKTHRSDSFVDDLDKYLDKFESDETVELANASDSLIDLDKYMDNKVELDYTEEMAKVHRILESLIDLDTCMGNKFEKVKNNYDEIIKFSDDSSESEKSKSAKDEDNADNLIKDVENHILEAEEEVKVETSTQGFTDLPPLQG